MAKLTSEQWDVISFSEQFWRENGFFPALEDMATELGRTVSDIEAIVFDELTKKHLEARGIDWNINHPPGETSASDRRKGRAKRLTDIQLATVSTILNPADKRSITAKLESLGVPAGTYAGWKKNKVFMDYMKSQGEALFGEFMPDMHDALIRQATSGDVKAIKFAYEVTGRYRPNQGNDMQNVQLLIIKLIEVIQQHVKDPLTLQRIAQDIKVIQGGLESDGSNGQVKSISSG